MTTTPTTADPLAPLAALVASVTAPGRAATVSLGRPIASDAAGWLPAGHLADPRRPHLGDLLRILAARWGAQPRPAALLAWKIYSHRIALPVALGWALNRRVPLVAMEQVLVRWEGVQPWLRMAVPRPFLAVLPSDRCAGAPGTVVVEDERALLATVRAALIDGQVGAGDPRAPGAGRRDRRGGWPRPAQLPMPAIHAAARRAGSGQMPSTRLRPASTWRMKPAPRVPSRSTS
jgi:hypothetical protein